MDYSLIFIYLYTLKPQFMQKQRDGFNGERALVLPQPIVHEMEKDPLSSMLHITDIGYYPKAISHFRERKEPINQHVFIYCIKGKGWFCLEQQKYTMTENQYVILPAGSAHSYGADDSDPWTIYWIHFKGKLSSRFIQQPVRPLELKPGVCSRISNRIELFEEIFHTLEMGYSHENLLYACSVFHHYLGSLYYLQQYRNVGGPGNTEHTDLIATAIHYMKENLEKKLTVADLAKYIGYSPSHFSSLFEKRTGYAPLTYFNHLKIQQACALLDFSNMKINQICYKIGIEDPYYFSRLFSKIMEMSPSEYKKQKKG